MVKYVEYNLINNIPIIYPDKNTIKYSLCPRYAIADSEKIMKCFETYKESSNILLHDNNRFKYIKIDISKYFKTMNAEIEALYCYAIIDHSTDLNIDYKNFESIVSWLQGNINNHYIMMTTPILKYKDVHYSIANDNNISVVLYDDVSNEEITINKLINTNCFTICDNFNILISLYHMKCLSKKEFIEATILLEQCKYFYYTPSIWIQYMNVHRILNACDIPVLHLALKPYMIDKQIIELYDWFFTQKFNIYMLIYYKHSILFTTIISSTYPNLNLELLKLILGDDIQNKQLLKQKLLHPDEETVSLTPDFYGLCASLCHNKSLWKFWCKYKNILLVKLLDTYELNALYLLSDLLIPLFRLYSVGYEDIKIKKNRVHKMWKDILQIVDENQKALPVFLEHYIISNKCANIPYVFLLDIYNSYDLDFMIYKKIHVYKNNINICRYTSLYKILQEHTQMDNLYYFYRNVIHKRIFYILMCLYKKFHMFAKGNSTKYCHKHVTGELIVSFLQKNLYYLT